MRTLATQKGRYRIYQYLKELDIRPECESDDDDMSSYNMIRMLVDIGKKMRDDGMRFRSEIPMEIQKKIKNARRHFIEEEKIKTELCVDENGRKTDMMEFYDNDADDARALLARPWAHKKIEAVRLFNCGAISESEFNKVIVECVD